ncbi:MAG: S9 family peptidase, partial [Eudoraea sp.]|nr:S9 family peptidase [Eudoraea sp.]
MTRNLFFSTVILFTVVCLNAQVVKPNLSYLDVYELQYASDPQIAPNGEWIVYRRMQLDILKDRAVGNLWMVKSDGSSHQKLTSREGNESSPRWSPSGDRVAFVSSTDEGSEIYMYWVSTGKFARLSQLPFSPSSLSWSPQGNKLAFSMFVPKAPPVIAKMPKKPKGAKWAESPRITDRVYHEADGRGYIKPGFNHIFSIRADGGAPHQLTSGDYHHRGRLSWSKTADRIYFSANRSENWEYEFRNSEVYSVSLNDGNITALTDRNGPDRGPVVSPDGKLIAFTGYEDKVQTYQVSKLYIMNTDGSDKRELTTSLDRSVRNLQWNSKSNGLYFSYDNHGNTKIGHVSLDGKVSKLGDNLGGTTLGRPYGGGSYSVSKDGTIAYTHSRPQYPAEVAVRKVKSGKTALITLLNKGLLSHRSLGKVEEVWYTSSFDERQIQAWLVYPPNYDPNKKYPLLVENHGGPISNYGDRFSTEMQLYAAAGYIVLYPNPRGSTGYGEEFGNLLYNNYPGQDYNDVMDGVD